MGKFAFLILAMILIATPVTAEARCFKFQRDCGASTSTPTPSTRVITNTARQRLGDLYDPGPGRRLQIRNTARQILGYIEKPSGRITNTSRQEIGNIESLLK